MVPTESRLPSRPAPAAGPDVGPPRYTKIPDNLLIILALYVPQHRNGGELRHNITVAYSHILCNLLTLRHQQSGILTWGDWGPHSAEVQGPHGHGSDAWDGTLPILILYLIFSIFTILAVFLIK